MTNQKKSIAKLFGPVLLLTGALALPADLGAAGTPKSIVAAKPEKHQEKHGKKQVHTKVVQRQKVVQKQVHPKQVHQNQVRRQQVHQQQVRKQVQLQRQATVQRQVANQRQVALQQAEARRQAQLRAARQRNVVVVRPRARTFVARPYAYRTSPYYRNGNYYLPAQGRDRSVLAADGYLDASRDCLILRGHEGQVYSLVGDTGGLQEGDHVRLLGRMTYDRYCGAQALDVTQVQAVWADPKHRQVYYDHLADGPFNRYYDDNRYDDDRYDDNRY